MKSALLLSLMLATGPFAKAAPEENALTSLYKSAATVSVINGANRLPLSQALSQALHHAENERVRVEHTCTKDFENATTILEQCYVSFSKVQSGAFRGECGEFSKGAYVFRFARALRSNAIYEIRGDIDLEITLR